MKNKLIIIMVVIALLPQIKCSSGSSTAEVNQEPSAVQIYHNIPAEVLLTDIPFIAEFTLEMPTGSTGDIAYYSTQLSKSDTVYLPNGITYQEISMELDLKDKSATVLVAAANNAGAITRVNLEVILNTDCPGCDLSWNGEGENDDYFGIDFSYADLTGASLRGRHLSENDFSYANLVGIDFSSDISQGIYTNLVRASFIGADLYLANFEGTYPSSAEWNNARCPDGSYANDHGNTCEGHLSFE